MSPATSGHIALQFDSGDWYQLTKTLRAYSPELVRSLRRRLRGVGQEAVDEIKNTLGLPSPDGGPDDGLYRQMLADATKVTVSFGRRSAGVGVRTSNRSLPEEHQPIMRAYNLRDFRHPVFGDREDWVAQKGRPYFDEKFMADVMARARAAADRAMTDAYAHLERLVNNR